jgi:hypothetical protein
MRIAVVSIETSHHRETETNERFRSVLELLRDGGHDVHLVCSRFWPEDRTRIEREGIVRGASLVAVAAVVLGTLVRILGNLPFQPVAVPAVIERGVTTGTPLVVALGAVAVALASHRPPVRVGLLAVGVFGLLAALVPAATVAAMVGVTLGGGLTLAGWVGRSPRSLPLVAVTLLFVAGVATSLSSAVGILPAGGRSVGAMLSLAAVGSLPLVVDGERIDLAAGALAGCALLVAAVTSPYVTGATLLTGFAVTGVPLALVALALAGGVAAATAGLRGRQTALVAGAGLRLRAGVPVTVPRATALARRATLAPRGPHGPPDREGTP